MPLFLDVLPDIPIFLFINIDCNLSAFCTTPYQINYSNLNHSGFAQYGYNKYVNAANVFEEKDQG
jgi:hypothetical protein